MAGPTSPVPTKATPGMRLELRQSQQLVMTPQLQQAIHLLQLSSAELNELIEKEVEQNPVLEMGDGDNDVSLGTNNADAGSAPDRPFDLQDMTGNHTAGNNDSLDIDIDNQFTGNDNESLGSWDNVGSGGSFNFDDEYDPLANATDTKNLRDHLLEQIQLDLPDPAERMIAMVLLDHLDEAGYCRADFASLATSLATSIAAVEDVLQKLQRMDPAGIFARNLQECLLLQLRDRASFTPALMVLLDNLDILASGNMAKLQKLCDVSLENLKDMITELRSTNPKPGTLFDYSVPATAIPDLLVRRANDGSWFLELNPDTLPKVLINNSYYEKISGAVKSKQEKDYLNDRMNAANWLVKALHQRATTMMKVGGEIIRRQDAFLERGVSALKPMTLKDVAEAIGMHESTISRVTTAKYMATPRGLFELKYFFSSSLASAHGGDALSSEAVRHRIKQLIDGEDASRPLSDDQLVLMLQSEGTELARRTVAKYRESLKIPSSFHRRRK